MMTNSEIKNSLFIFALKILFIQHVHAHILRLPCLTYGNFSIVKNESRLTSNVLETFNALSENECENECIKHRLCKSINTKNSTGFNCELISKSTEDPFDSVVSTAMEGWTHKTTDYKARNIGPYCEEKDPCSTYFGTTCIDTCYIPGYACQRTTKAAFKHCQEAYTQGNKRTGVYQIHVDRTLFFDAPCDMETDGGGWIVLQRRVDASIDFDREWKDYETGFGDLNGNFWLGLDKIHKLAGQVKGATLRVDLRHMDYPNTLYAQYDTFWIHDTYMKYRIYVNWYWGNAGDSFRYAGIAKFTTKDNDNDYDNGNCAIENRGGWWYDNCYYSSLNSIYPSDNRTDNTYMTWFSIKNEHGKVTFSEMKMKYRSGYV